MVNLRNTYIYMYVGIYTCLYVVGRVLFRFLGTFLNFARTGYPDDALRDMVQQRPQMNVHFCVYTHLFRFTHHHIEFLQVR